MQETLYINNWCRISDQKVFLRNKRKAYEENFANFAAFIKGLYKKEQVSYPKFYKMDNLSKLGFLTAELLLKGRNVLSKYGPEEIGVVVANSSSSLDTDYDYQELIRDKSNYFPSPSVFVYTLPNIMIGEICIRHKIKGENAFLISRQFDAGQIHRYVSALMDQGRLQTCICGWVEVLEEKYVSLLMVVEKRLTATSDAVAIKMPFNIININQLYKQTEI